LGLSYVVRGKNCRSANCEAGTPEVSIMISRPLARTKVGSGESYTRSRSSSRVPLLYKVVVVSCRVRGTCATDFWHVSIIDSSLSATRAHYRSLLSHCEANFSSLLSTAKYSRDFSHGETWFALPAAKIVRRSVKLCKRTFARSFPECNRMAHSL
jgi:hypothetical protein